MYVRVSDQEWALISSQLSHLPKPKHPGRPRASDRELFEGILYILVTGSPWSELPNEYPAKSSCHRRFQTWSSDGSFERLRRTLVKLAYKHHRLNLKEGFIDGSFIKAKRGAALPSIRLDTLVREALH